MKLTLKIAEESEIKNIQLFFKIHLNSDTHWIVNEEFLCPFWVSSAIKRNQIVILKQWFRILWALRFYPRKRDDIVSVYQFALAEKVRWKGLIKKMLEKTWYKDFDLACFLNSDFNKYYNKTWWKLFSKDEKLNYWRMYI
jgi:hypothetical protein